MTDLQNLFIIIGVALAVIVGIIFLIPYLVKRGINLSGGLAAAGTVLETADLVVDGLVGIVPSAALNVVDKVIDYAQKAVAAAEQMYKAAQITKDQRNAEAVQIVKDLLAAAGIEVTPEVEKIIGGMIEAAVLALPKTDAPAEAPPAAQVKKAAVKTK